MRQVAWRTFSVSQFHFSVDFVHFDSAKDPSLNKGTSEGMKLLVEKYKPQIEEFANKQKKAKVTKP